MNEIVSVQQIKGILDTLPIGYYLGRNTPVTVSDSIPTSKVNPLTGEITIAANNIRMVLDGLDKEVNDIEPFVRAALYHELSHLILSPKMEFVTSYVSSKSYVIADQIKYKNVINIFEDERIESLMFDYYMKVDFKDFLFKLNKKALVSKDKDALQYFFRIVRFRQGPNKFLDRVNKLISTWKDLDSSDYFLTYHKISQYFEDIMKLYLDVEEEYKKNQAEQSENKLENTSDQKDDSEKDKDKSEENASERQDKSNPSQSKSTEKNDGDRSEPDSEESKSNSSQENSENSESEDNPEQTTTEQNELDPETDEIRKHAVDQVHKGGIPEIMDKTNIQKKFAKLTNMFSDAMIDTSLTRIITRACKKRASYRGVTNCYMGRICPKSVGRRQDYKWFHKVGDDGSNRFNRVHITLWVDKSGSFWKSIDKINCMIKSLIEFEKKMTDSFSFDVITMDDVNQIHDKTQLIEARGGNDFGPEVESLYRQTQKAGWSNYNIIVWDGDLASDSQFKHNIYTYVRMNKKAFDLLNSNRTIVVSDTFNRRYIQPTLTRARVKFISHDYAENFIAEVLNLMETTIG